MNEGQIGLLWIGGLFLFMMLSMCVENLIKDYKLNYKGVTKEMKLLRIEKDLLISYFTLIICLVLKANVYWLGTWAIIFGWVSFYSRLKANKGDTKDEN